MVALLDEIGISGLVLLGDKDHLLQARYKFQLATSIVIPHDVEPIRKLDAQLSVHGFALTRMAVKVKERHEFLDSQFKGCKFRMHCVRFIEPEDVAFSDLCSGYT
jgi:hypothetical protein